MCYGDVLDGRFQRTEELFGENSVSLLGTKKVILFGLGGVGGAAFEALVRGAVGTVAVVDKDTVDITNINRQLLATEATVGMLKTDAAFKRAELINPNANIIRFPLFYLPENADLIDLSEYDYVIDAIDNISAKTELIKRAKEKNVPVISCMGTGNKIHPELLEITDISKTSVCPLARAMRRNLKAVGIEHLDVVYSRETPFSVSAGRTPSSNSFVPPVAGYLLSSAVITNLLKEGT